MVRIMTAVYAALYVFFWIVIASIFGMVADGYAAISTIQLFVGFLALVATGYLASQGAEECIPFFTIPTVAVGLFAPYTAHETVAPFAYILALAAMGLGALYGFLFGIDARSAAWASLRRMYPHTASTLTEREEV